MNTQKNSVTEKQQSLLKAYFLNACLLAMVKETGGEEPMIIEDENPWRAVALGGFQKKSA